MATGVTLEEEKMVTYAERQVNRRSGPSARKAERKRENNSIIEKEKLRAGRSSKVQKSRCRKKELRGRRKNESKKERENTKQGYNTERERRDGVKKRGGEKRRKGNQRKSKEFR